MLSANSMTSKCVQCGRFVSSTDGAKCIKCGSLSHRECVKLSPSGPVPSKWACHTCNKGKNKQNKGETTQGSSTPIPKPPVTGTPNSFTATALTSAVNDIIHNDFTNSIVTEIRLLRSEMASFRGEIAQLNSTLSEFNSRVENIEIRLSHLEEQSASRNSEGDDSVQAKIFELQSQLNERDQALLMNDVQISGLKEVSGENLISLSCLLAKKLGVELDDRDIVSAERSGPRYVASASSGDGVEAPRSRPVIVRLARRAVRDNLLRAARVRRGADSSGIIDAEPRRFYVNEHLTRTNRQLFYKAREEGRNKNWKYVWTKGGRVYVRQTVTSPVHRVGSAADLDRLFGSASF